MFIITVYCVCEELEFFEDGNEPPPFPMGLGRPNPMVIRWPNPEGRGVLASVVVKLASRSLVTKNEAARSQAENRHWKIVEFGWPLTLASRKFSVQVVRQSQIEPALFGSCRLRGKTETDYFFVLFWAPIPCQGVVLPNLIGRLSRTLPRGCSKTPIFAQPTTLYSIHHWWKKINSLYIGKWP